VSCAFRSLALAAPPLPLAIRWRMWSSASRRRKGARELSVPLAPLAAPPLPLPTRFARGEGM